MVEENGGGGMGNVPTVLPRAVTLCASIVVLVGSQGRGNVVAGCGMESMMVASNCLIG